MRVEGANVLTVIFGSVFLFFLVVPYVFFIYRMPDVWRESRMTGVVLLAVVVFGAVGFIALISVTGFIAYLWSKVT
ncbi:MAG: hypothetical protein M0Z94_19775 [Dehalococcoidales bacterium]|nr:hypothetical protein [Dehalococcoidales bacterium]